MECSNGKYRLSMKNTIYSAQEKYTRWRVVSPGHASEVLLAYNHGSRTLIGEQFAKQDVRFSTIYNVNARYGKQGVEASSNFGYHTTANDAFLYQM